MQPSPNSKGHSEVVLLDSTSLQGIVVNINQQLIDEDQAGLRRSLVLTSPWIISGDQVELLQKEVAKLQVRINQLNRDAVEDKQAADGLLAELNEKRALVSTRLVPGTPEAYQILPPRCRVLFKGSVGMPLSVVHYQKAWYFPVDQLSPVLQHQISGEDLPCSR